MKKTYINPEMVVIPFVATQHIALSLTSGIGGDTGITRGDDIEAPSSADVKGIGDIDLWDEVW